MPDASEPPTVGNPGRVVLITGATSGLGYAAAAELGRRGDTVLVHGRTQAQAENAVQLLSKTASAPAGRYVAVSAELSSLEQVRQLASQAGDLARGRVDVLINNAGAQFKSRRLSADGVEMTTAVVHLAAAALTRLLLGHLKQAARLTHTPARVINVSSVNERIGKPVTDWSYAAGYGQIRAYSNAKLMALAYTYGLARHHDAEQVTFSAADPGVVFTDFGKKAGGSAGLADRLLRPVAPLLIASPGKAARRSVLLAADPVTAAGTGGFYAKGAVRASSKRSRDPAVIDQVYALTEEKLSSAEI